MRHSSKAPRDSARNNQPVCLRLAGGLAGAVARTFVLAVTLSGAVYSSVNGVEPRMQAPAGSTPPHGGSIYGHVLTSDGRALRNAPEVRVVAVTPQNGTTDDTMALEAAAPLRHDGTFVIDRVVGARIIRVTGLPTGWEIDRVAAGRRETQPLHIATGERVDVIIIVARTSIRGRVTNSEGEPLANAFVTAWRLRGDREVDPVAMPPAKTTTVGEFAIRGLPDGWYLVEARVERLRHPHSRLLIPGEPPFTPTFYPGGDRNDAVAVKVAAGEIANNVEIPLRRNNLWSVSGRFERQDEQMPLDAHILVPGSGDQALPLDTDGRFEVIGLRPGRYALWARGLSSSGLKTGWLLIDVSAELTDLAIALDPAASIHGRVQSDSGELPAGLKIAAAWTHDGEDVDVVWRDQADVSSEGEFEINGLFGERTLHVLGLPDNWRVDRVVQRDQPIERLRLTPGAEVDVTVLITRR